MEKRKTYEISIIDKTYSKIILDETKFYTSDTALELGFELKETEYDFESAEIVLLNIDDRSLVTRPVAKVLDSFAYELDDDITAHYGEWRGQLRFEQAGEIYVSSPVKFRIENDLSNERPPQLSDVQSWVSLKRYADSLTEELKQAVLSVEGLENTLNENETVRQTTFETNESERDETFSTNETTRQTQELEREEAEATRQTTFTNNEVNRTETFNANEATRQVNESARQQAESGRQSAEIIRVENENQRNLTSIEEFIKLQDSVGGRNLIKWNPNNELKTISKYNQYYIDMPELNKQVLLTPGEIYTIGVDYQVTQGDGRLYIGRANNDGTYVVDSSVNVSSGNRSFNFTAPDLLGSGTYLAFRFIRTNTPASGKFTIKDLRVYRGSYVSLPWTKAPDNYDIVTKDDYYNHIKLMNDFRDSQFNQLKKAVLALGGTI